MRLLRLAGPLAVIALSSCTTWKNVPLAPPARRDTVVVGRSGISDDGRGVRVRFTSGWEMHFRLVAVRGDTLLGFWGADSIALGRDTIRALDVRVVSRKRTAVAAGIGYAAYLVAYNAYLHHVRETSPW